MDNPVDLSDLEELWRPISDQQDRSSAEALLRYAWAKLQNESVGLVDRITAGTVRVDDVKYILLAAVKRVLDNPSGHRQESRTIDDFTKSWVLDAAVSTGELYFSAVQLRSLNPDARARRGKAFTIITGPS